MRAPLFLRTERLLVLITARNNRLRKKGHPSLSKFHAHNCQSMERATGIRNLCQWARNLTVAGYVGDFVIEERLKMA